MDPSPSSNSVTLQPHVQRSNRATDELTNATGDRIQLIRVVHSDCPAFFFVAMKESANGDPELAGSGRGLTHERAVASCLGETIERVAAARISAVPITYAERRRLPGP